MFRLLDFDQLFAGDIFRKRLAGDCRADIWQLEDSPNLRSLPHLWLRPQCGLPARAEPQYGRQRRRPGHDYALSGDAALAGLLQQDEPRSQSFG